MRSFVAAAVQLAPRPGPVDRETIRANNAHAVGWVRRCVEATGAELVVLPETASTGFVTGLDAEQLWEVLSDVPGPISEPLQEAARELGIHLVWGSYRRGPEPGVVYNSSVVIGPDGAVLGIYDKTHPFTTELRSRGGWVTPGDRISVVDTALGAIGQIICFDGDYPELSRITALRGAEIIVRPSALLRSADIWELTTRARAYDNHVFVIGANATGLDPAGTIYFGNSMIVTPIAEVIARAASHECWVSARLDPATALTRLTPGSSIGQGFDHLADRNLDLIRRYRDDLMEPGRSLFGR